MQQPAQHQASRHTKHAPQSNSASGLDGPDTPQVPSAATSLISSSGEAMPGDPTVDQPPPPSSGPDDTLISLDAEATTHADDTPAATEPARGQQYTWFDGEVERTIWLKLTTPDRRSDGLGDPLDHTVSDDADGLVFVDESGTEMTLPGGVLLGLNPEWSSSEVWEFLANNGVPSSVVTELEWLDNGFFIDTAPGLASLELANELANEDGVGFATPNWSTEVELQ